MRVAVAGAAGLVGRAVVAVLGQQGHDVVRLSRTDGVDLTDGNGLDAALRGVDAVVDVVSTDQLEPTAAQEFFSTTSRVLLDAEVRAGVGHHVALSIVNVDQVEGNGHYAGKRAQERVVRSGAVPWTVVRATQFHDFPAQVVGWTTVDGVAAVAPLLVQPVAVTDLADVLVEVAVGAPQHDVVEVAGPETQDFVDMARRTLAARRDPTRLRPSWHDGPFTVELAGDVLLPGPGARLGRTTFDSWLEQQAADADH